MIESNIRIGISVIICCYNSARLLPETLKHLANQNIQKFINWEVIIANNNSTDNTTETAFSVWESLGRVAKLQVVDQAKAGLSYAREKGFETAIYEYMLLCDDDNWLQPDYLQLAYEIMSANPAIGILGGKGEAVFETEKPGWFDKVEGHYATGPQALSSGDLSETRRFVFGAGAIVRNSGFRYIKERGFTSLLTDRKGKELSSGGDSELCYVFLLAGYKIWYDNRLQFGHFLTKERLTWGYLANLNKAFTFALFYLRSYTFYFTEKSLSKKLIWLRDLRHLLRFLPSIIKEYLKQPKGTDEQKIQQIMLESHLQLIKLYLSKRSELDKTIYKVGQLAQRLRK